jgi:purine catabolism regulator
MPLTVRELLASPLGLELLVEGELDRRIRWVHATEQPDPTPYLRGGEVVLTDGIALRQGASPREYVARLRRADVAAVGYGLIEGEAPAPPDLIDACRAERITLFAVPVDVPYLAISEVFVERLTLEREAPLLEHIRRGDRLVRAAAADGGLAGTLDVLRSELGLAVRVLDRTGTVLAESPPEPDVEDAAWWTFPLRSVGSREGVLAVAGGPGDPTVAVRAAIDQAVAVITLELVHARALRETQRRFAGELFDLIAAGDAQAAAVATRLRGFGMTPTAPLIAIVCETSRPGEMLPELENALAGTGAPGVAAAKVGRLLAVLQWSGELGSPADVGARLGDALADEVTIGVSGVAHDSSALRTSLAEAAHACSVARLRRDEGRYATHADLGSHRLILALLEPHVAASLSATLLGPVADYDSRRHTDLLDTLRAFLDSNGQWQATADTLRIHVNTLRQRLERVEQLTGKSMDTIEGRVDLFLALTCAQAAMAESEAERPGSTGP